MKYLIHIVTLQLLVTIIIISNNIVPTLNSTSHERVKLIVKIIIIAEIEVSSPIKPDTA